MPSITLHFKKRPSLFNDLSYIFMVSIWSRWKKFHGIESIPQITALLDGWTIKQKHLDAFNTICEINNRDKVSFIYPVTLGFPLIQRMLALKEAPSSIFNVLDKRLQIEQYGKIPIHAKLDIRCETAGLRIVPKGLELDVSAFIQTAGTMIWKATETFFYRGHFGDVVETDEQPELNTVHASDEITRWYLPAGLGFRFAKICGDSNGLHYSKQYARLVGFKRDFAQPFLVLGNSMKRILGTNKEDAVSLDVAFKGPFYYERNVIIKGALYNNHKYIEIFNEGNERPCMVGILSAPK